MIYLDNSATTKPCQAAVDAAIRAMTQDFGNPSSRYTLGLSAERLLNEARAKVAAALHVSAETVFFTSGGTEGNNLAILGGANQKIGSRVVTTAIEHPSVLNAFAALEKRGFQVTYVAPKADGTVSAEAILKAVDDKTAFVSVMHVNNETGAILPIDQLGRAIHRKSPRALFHVDAVQSFGKIPLFPVRWDIDLLTVSGHKVHGPKGIGALYKAPKAVLHPTTFGGGQEKGLRSGTENMPGICAFAAAVSLLSPSEQYKSMAKLKADFAERLLALDGVELNGSLDTSLPYILNVSFTGLRSEIMLNALSEKGVFVSAGSACSKGASKASSVLRAMGAPHPDNAIRFSFSRDTTSDELTYAADSIKTLWEALR